MKRTPLARSTKPLKRTPIKRSTKPVNKKRKEARRVSVVRDQKYMDWCKTQPCWACIAAMHQTGCGSIAMYSEPAHTAKNNGRSSKGPDDSCIPLCTIHHHEMDGRLNTKIVTKEQFAAKYGLDLAAVAAEHYARYKQEQSK